MSESHRDDHWGLLANELGATPSEEPAAPAEKRADASLPPVASKAKVEVPRKPQPASDWDLLADELGIAPQDVAGPAVPAAETGPAVSESYSAWTSFTASEPGVTSDTSSAAVPRADREVGESFGRFESEAGRSSSRGSAYGGSELESSGSERRASGRHERGRQDRERLEAESFGGAPSDIGPNAFAPQDYDATGSEPMPVAAMKEFLDDATEPLAPRGERPKVGDADEDESEDDHRSGRRRRRRRRTRPGEESAAKGVEPIRVRESRGEPEEGQVSLSEELEQEWEEDILRGDEVEAIVEADELDADERDVEHAEEDDQAETQRGSRRRRSRRGRGRKDRDAPAAKSQAEPAHDRQSPSFDEAEDDEADDALDADSELRPGHKAIPTWDEAIGVLITANIEARARRPEHRSRNYGSREGRGDGGQRRGGR